MTKKVFTVTIDVKDSLQAKFSKKVTPRFIQRALDSAITDINLSGPEQSPFTIQVAGGGPFTDKEAYRIWRRDAVRRPSDSR